MGPTLGAKTDRGGHQTPRRAGARVLLLWVALSLLGFPLAGLLGHVVAGSVDGVVPALIGGALTGVGVGLAQWVLLWRRAGVGPEWILATGVGLAVGLVLGAVAVGYQTTMLSLAVMGAICGATVGVAQGLLLKRHGFVLWPMWMGAMPILWAVGWIVTTAGGIDVEQQYIVFGAYGSVAFGILSGALLVVGLRRSPAAVGPATSNRQR